MVVQTVVIQDRMYMDVIDFALFLRKEAERDNTTIAVVIKSLEGMIASNDKDSDKT